MAGVLYWSKFMDFYGLLIIVILFFFGITMKTGCMEVGLGFQFFLCPTFSQETQYALLTCRVYWHSVYSTDNVFQSLVLQQTKPAAVDWFRKASEETAWQVWTGTHCLLWSHILCADSFPATTRDNQVINMLDMYWFYVMWAWCLKWHSSSLGLLRWWKNKI